MSKEQELLEKAEIIEDKGDAVYEKNYKPFGEEWGEEINKFSKKQLIMMLKVSLQKNKPEQTGRKAVFVDDIDKIFEHVGRDNSYYRQILRLPMFEVEQVKEVQGDRS